MEKNNSNKRLIIICATVVACITIICLTAATLFNSANNSQMQNPSQPATSQGSQNSSSSPNTSSNSSTGSNSSTTSPNATTTQTGYQQVIDQVKNNAMLIAPSNESSGKSLSVAYRDINSDGSDEMFLGYNDVWWSIFTLQNNSAYKIVQKESVRDTLTLRDDNTILRVKVSADGEDLEHNVFSFPASIRITGRVDDDSGDGATILFHAEKNHDRDDWYPEYEIGVGQADRDCSQAEYDSYLTQMNINAAAASLNWSTC